MATGQDSAAVEHSLLVEVLLNGAILGKGMIQSMQKTYHYILVSIKHSVNISQAY